MIPISATKIIFQPISSFINQTRNPQQYLLKFNQATGHYDVIVRVIVRMQSD